MAASVRKEVLFGDDGVELDGELHINEEFAKKYDKWRAKEELQKLKDRYGETALHETSSSSSESSDSEKESELDHVIEKDFLKTISLLKSKDPVIYDKDICFFPEKEDNEEVGKVKKSKKEKPLYWKDQERQVLLENQGVFSDDENERPKASFLLDSALYQKEKEYIKQSFAVSSDSDDDLLTERVTSKEEKDLEEAEYIEWLKGEKKKLVKDAELKKDLKFLHHYWNSSNIDSDEAFLRDYILNKRYLEPKESEVPTYDEIIADEENLSEDEKTLDQQETFEHKYNFRFEEPDPEFIKQFPRTLKDSLRRNDSKRKCKREEIRERKKKEKEKKKEEIKRLKALKLKEIEQKIDQLKEITGNEEMSFEDLDLEGDFDPEKYDEKMKEMFNEEYYQTEEDIQKPVFPPDEELDENWDSWIREEDNAEETQNESDEECNITMDADHDPKAEFQKSIIQSTKRGKSRKKSKFAELLSKKKPVFDPEEKCFEKYLEEYYKLDCEDIIDGMPVRFSYRNVVPNGFGLTVNEILSADDKQLNRWCSLKKTCQYRTDEEELYDIHAFENKARNTEAKKKILSSIYQNEEDKQILFKGQKKSLVNSNSNKKPHKHSLSNHSITSEDKSADCHKRKRKHKKEHLQKDMSKQTLSDVKHQEGLLQNDMNKKSQKSRPGDKNYQEANNSSKDFEMSDERLRAYGINPKKFKKKLKWGKDDKQ